MPPREAVRAASEHLWYEVAMLHRSGCAILSTLPLGWVGHNAVVEAFALHCRNLIDFFYNRTNPRFPDDVLAEHYFPTPDGWHRICPSKSALLETAHRNANKFVSHLTYARIGLTFDQKAWQIPSLLAEINALLSLFVAHGDKELIVPEPPDVVWDATS